MARVTVQTDTNRRNADAPAQMAALDLAGRLPHLVLQARRVTAAVAGVHGRRRAGPGESFWQFRPYAAGESASRIDWRRSARDDRLYVRQREWEAAHSVHIWIDRSASMAYRSSLAGASKVERALVLGLALADLLVDGGERVGLIGLMPPRAGHGIVERMAETLLRAPAAADEDLPAPIVLAPQAEAIIITDALVSPGEFGRSVAQISARGARGHLLRIVDPVEESFPFTGEALLEEVESERDLRVGDAAAWGDIYRPRFAAHGEAVAQACTSRGWTATVHRTDRPAAEAALRLMTLISGNAQAGGRAGR
jgi:uncharacterized protein (DUF58 family)